MTKPRKIAAAARYEPVSFDPAAFVAGRSAKDPEFRAAFAALADKFQALDALLAARREADLTQARLAQRRESKQSARARVEACSVRASTSPRWKLSADTRVRSAAGWKSGWCDNPRRLPLQVNARRSGATAAAD